MLASVDWKIWNFARFEALTFVLSYYIHYLFIYQLDQLAQMVDAGASNPLVLGSNPRTLAISYIIFQCLIPCSAQGQDHHAHSIITIHASSYSNPRARIQGIPWRQFNALAQDLKKSTEFTTDGPGFLDQHLSNWDYTPLVCLSSHNLFFSNYHIICCFN